MVGLCANWIVIWGRYSKMGCFIAVVALQDFPSSLRLKMTLWVSGLLTLCSMNGTLVVGSRLWSISNKVESGTPNRPLSAQIKIKHRCIYTHTGVLYCFVNLQFVLHVSLNSVLLSYCVFSYRASLCVTVPLVLTFKAFWAFRSIPAVSNRAVISTRTSLRTWQNIKDRLKHRMYKNNTNTVLEKLSRYIFYKLNAKYADM